jgi:hypothetical protein
MISAKKEEPEWLLQWRLKAFRLWQTMKEPTWHNVKYDPINYQDIVYYSAPKKKKVLNSLDEMDPEVRATFDKLGIPIEEQKMFAGVAVDAVFDSVSVATTFKKGRLASVGIIFCSFSEAVREHTELEEVSQSRRGGCPYKTFTKKYTTDTSSRRSQLLKLRRVFSTDGSFRVYIKYNPPKGALLLVCRPHVGSPLPEWSCLGRSDLHFSPLSLPTTLLSASITNPRIKNTNPRATVFQRAQFASATLTTCINQARRRGRPPYDS